MVSSYGFPRSIITRSTVRFFIILPWSDYFIARFILHWFSLSAALWSVLLDFLMLHLTILLHVSSIGFRLSPRFDPSYDSSYASLWWFPSISYALLARFFFFIPTFKKWWSERISHPRLFFLRYLLPSYPTSQCEIFFALYWCIPNIATSGGPNLVEEEHGTVEIRDHHIVVPAAAVNKNASVEEGSSSSSFSSPFRRKNANDTTITADEKEEEEEENCGFGMILSTPPTISIGATTTTITPTTITNTTSSSPRTSISVRMSWIGPTEYRSVEDEHLFRSPFVRTI